MQDLKNPRHKISLCKKVGNIPSIKFTLNGVDLKSKFNGELKELDCINFSTLKASYKDGPLIVARKQYLHLNDKLNRTK